MFEELISRGASQSLPNDIRELVDFCTPILPAEGVRRLTPGKKLACFGAGEMGRAIPETFRRLGRNVDFFIDNDPAKKGTLLDGIPVVSVANLKAMPDDVELFITCGRTREIVLQLHREGLLDRVKGSLLIHDSDEIDLPALIEKEEDDIRRLFSLWSDEKSKVVFYGLLNYYLSQNIGFVFPVVETKYRQYFDSEIYRFGDEEFFIDVGAFDGQTTRDFISLTKNRFKNIFIFEPSRVQYRQIIESFSPAADPRIRIEGFALYDTETALGFGGVTSTARIDESAAETVSAVPLDLFLERENVRDRITFLKMDIEGAEVRALKGASRTIRETKPSLAICVYHRPSDLWRIPLYLHELVPEYRLYLRHYTDQPTETVCYATPR